MSKLKARFPKQFKLDLNLRGSRMLNAGNVKVTVKSKKTGEHITVHFKSRKAPERRPGRWKAVGPNEATDIFIEAGRDDPVARLRKQQDGTWKDQKPYVNGSAMRNDADPARVWAAIIALEWLCGSTHPQAEFKEWDCCGRCGRELTDPVSIERGIGPECIGKLTGSQHQKKSKAEYKEHYQQEIERVNISHAKV